MTNGKPTMKIIIPTTSNVGVIPRSMFKKLQESSDIPPSLETIENDLPQGGKKLCHLHLIQHEAIKS